MKRQSDPGLVVQELIYSGLDALRSVTELDLCAYLHTVSDGGPQLFLSAPDLASVDPNEAFTLFSALRDTLDHDHGGDDTLLLGEYFATAVTTEGPASRGLHVVGTRTSAPTGTERDTLTRLARALGAVVHRLESIERPAGAAPPTPEPRPSRVAVESVEGGARAEVSVGLGEELRTGTAEDVTPLRAVAVAVIDAIDPSIKLVEASEGEIGGERAVLVLMTNELGRGGLGAALVGEEADPLRAGAVAALQATRRLQESAQRSPAPAAPPPRQWGAPVDPDAPDPPPFR